MATANARPEQIKSQVADFKALAKIGEKPIGVQIDNHRALKSEETVAPIQIINRALRDAALAPTVFDALDRCADALLQLAEISRAEVSNG